MENVYVFLTAPHVIKNLVKNKTSNFQFGSFVKEFLWGVSVNSQLLTENMKLNHF